MVRSIKLLLLIAICFVSSCGQTPEGKKLIDDINATKVKARHFGKEADRKWNEARGKNEDEQDRLIEEAANLYGQASETLQEAATKATELAKIKNPSWYEEYFGLQSKYFNNLARLAAGAKDELLGRKSGLPSESQLQAWKDELKRIGEENEQLKKQIASIESRQGIVLIKE
jgi:hypothetical protein